MASNRITDLPGLMYLWKVENLYLAGQPSALSWEHIKNLGVKKIINLRDVSEMDFSEEITILNTLGLEYLQFPICENGNLIPENCQKLSEMLNTTDPHFIHCASANRVGGWLITYLVQYRNMDFDDAAQIAEENGLSNPGYIEQAEDICNS